MSNVTVVAREPELGRTFAHSRVKFPLMPINPEVRFVQPTTFGCVTPLELVPTNSNAVSFVSVALDVMLKELALLFLCAEPTLSQYPFPPKAGKFRPTDAYVPGMFRVTFDGDAQFAFASEIDWPDPAIFSLKKSL